MLCLTTTLSDYLKLSDWGSGAVLANEMGVGNEDIHRWKRRGAVIAADGSLWSQFKPGHMYSKPVESLIAFNYRLMSGR